jgi:hypothetical protein
LSYPPGVGFTSPDLLGEGFAPPNLMGEGSILPDLSGTGSALLDPYEYARPRVRAWALMSGPHRTSTTLGVALHDPDVRTEV